ncbi:histidinol-phosphatase HisJ [Metabacillus herbersteinensis]|uniref:Histidinol-phosphatase n=1 Tax=Metabacillus herbersteinensis TaxID=283816 RepID=A0ABV6G9G5_9BACI
MRKIDGHIHTPFCPHGTGDTLEKYVEKAIEENFHEITFTEHAPLPKGFVDPTPLRDSSMSLEKLADYFQSIERLKEKYQNRIIINIGLEVDFIRGYEDEITGFLNQYGSFLTDSILSVHFIKLDDQYFCIDYDEVTFGEMVKRVGSLEKLHRLYYEAVLTSVNTDLGKYKPKRIGHLTLAHKFQKLFPVHFDFSNSIQTILQAIVREEMQIDYNVAGLRKEFCGETYPQNWIAHLAIQKKIPLVYGSDAHSARDLGMNYQAYKELELS